MIDSAVVNGIKIYPFKDINELIDYSIKKNKILVAVNARKIVIDEPRLKKIINKNIGYADGMGAKLALKKKTNFEVNKIPGCEIWLKLIDKYCDKKDFYFIGATSEVIEKTISKLKTDYPTLNIAGYRNGYMNSEKEKHTLIKDLKDKKPDIVFVAMGSPRQEYFMEECIEQYPALYQGLGGSFDLYVGKKKRPPKFIRDIGLEGVFIAFTEGVKKPRRRVSRFVTGLKMYIYLFMDKL